VGGGGGGGGGGEEGGGERGRKRGGGKGAKRKEEKKKKKKERKRKEKGRNSEWRHIFSSRHESTGFGAALPAAPDHGRSLSALKPTKAAKSRPYSSARHARGGPECLPLAPRATHIRDGTPSVIAPSYAGQSSTPGLVYWSSETGTT